MKYSVDQTVLPVSFGTGPHDYTQDTIIHVIHPQRDGSIELTILPACGTPTIRRIPATDAAMITAILRRSAAPNALPDKEFLPRRRIFPE